MLTEDLKGRLAALEGLISPEVGLRLAELAAQVPKDQAIVEIGSYKGKSTCYLTAGALSGHGARVHAIDPWDTKGNIGGRFGFDTRAVYADFLAQVQSMGFTEHVTHIKDFSWRAAKSWSKPIGLLYIDGSHTQKDVLSDWRMWSPFLMPKSFAAFDDYDTPRNPGVKIVVDRLMTVPRTKWTLGPAPLVVGQMP